MVNVFLFVQLQLHSFVITFTNRENLTAPLPVQLSFTVVRLFVEGAASADLFADDSSGL